MKRFAAILVFSTVAITAPKALADQFYAGTVSYLTTTTTSSDFSNEWAGYVGVNGQNGIQNFYWGGTRCTNITPITSTQFQILSDTVQYNGAIYMYYKRVGNSSCITGFSIYGGKK
jgi:hypothetical protein